MLKHMGLSVTTCLPAASAWVACGAWRSLGVARTTKSTAGSAKHFVEVAESLYPQVALNLVAGFRPAGGDAVEVQAAGQPHEIGVEAAASKAITDDGDIGFFHDFTCENGRFCSR